MHSDFKKLNVACFRKAKWYCFHFHHLHLLFLTMVSLFLLYHFGIGLNLFVKVFHALNAMQLYPPGKQEGGCITWRETRRKRHMNRAYFDYTCISWFSNISVTKNQAPNLSKQINLTTPWYLPRNKTLSTIVVSTLSALVSLQLKRPLPPIG